MVAWKGLKMNTGTPRTMQEGDAYTEGNSKEPCRAWSETRVGMYGWDAYVLEKKMEERGNSFTKTEVKVCCPYRDLEGGQAFRRRGTSEAFGQ